MADVGSRDGLSLFFNIQDIISAYLLFKTTVWKDTGSQSLCRQGMGVGYPRIKGLALDWSKDIIMWKGKGRVCGNTLKSRLVGLMVGG